MIEESICLFRIIMTQDVKNVPSEEKVVAIIDALVEKELTTEQQKEVEQVFEESRDFRSIGERITAPIDSIIEETSIVISNDPILNVSSELSAMNKSMKNVYDDIIDDDGIMMKFFKSIPGIGFIAQKIDESFDDASFSMKDINGKIISIFSGFDQAYESLGVSIDMQKKFLDGIADNLGGIIAYKNFLEQKIAEFKVSIVASVKDSEKTKYEMFLRNVEFFQSNLVVLIGNLEMAEKRLLIRLDSAQKLSLAMNSSKPIFNNFSLSSSMFSLSDSSNVNIKFSSDKPMIARRRGIEAESF